MICESSQKSRKNKTFNRRSPFQGVDGRANYNQKQMTAISYQLNKNLPHTSLFVKRKLKVNLIFLKG